MQKIIRSFAADFRKEVEKSRYRDDIVSIVLFGSAARGGFIKGYSDVDLIVVSKDENNREEIQEYMRSIVSRLNKKHNLLLEKSCSDERRFDNSVLNAVLRLESFFLWGTPIYVIPRAEFDIARKRVTSPKLWVMTTFIGALDQFLASLKETGIVIYGEDMIKDIKNTEFTMFDKIKLTIQPYYLLLLATIIAPFNAKFSLKHSMKACLYESEYELLWLHEKIKSYNYDEKLYDKLFHGHDFEINHLRKTMELRAGINRISVTKGQAFDYLVDSYRFVWSSHATMMGK